MRDIIEIPGGDSMKGSKKKLIQFGAGNIGRSFIGQVFSQAGYDVVFIDVEDLLISELNRKREYKVVIKKSDTQDIVHMVKNVRAVHAMEIDVVVEEIATADLIARDPLWVFVESYNQLILAKNSLKKELPPSNDIKLVNNIQAYVDRKLFIHNLGHASAAYFGYQHNTDIEYLGEVMENKGVEEQAKEAMLQSAAALLAEYPGEFTSDNLTDHVKDLLERFQNKALGDTVFRVGRDLPRKLEKSDRLVGAILLCGKHQLPYDAICRAVAAGFQFKAVDEKGKMFKADEDFHKKLDSEGIDGVLRSISRLDEGNALERDIAAAIAAAYESGRRQF